jgi:hypothetical protein
MHRTFSFLIAVLAAAPLIAQPAGAAGGLVLRDGDEVQLKFAEPLSSKTAQVDDPVAFVLGEDLKVGDVVVAKEGAKALGTVSVAEKAGMFGKGGQLSVRLEYLKVGGTKVKLRGTKSRTGESKQDTAIVLTVLLGPIGLIKHGKDIQIPEGLALKAFVADDIALPPAQ